MQYRTRNSVTYSCHLRGRVSKYVTNGSKTAVMNVIGFLCNSLGNSPVQRHESLGSRRACSCSEAGFSRQNGDRAWRVYYRRAAFCFAFLWAKWLYGKDIHKEIFPVRVGSVCLVKRFTSGGKRFADDEDVETEIRKWLRQQSKDFCAAGFDALVKRRDGVSMFVEDMSSSNCFLQVRITHMTSICGLLTDSPS
jgi:hypothetical protein